MQIVGGITEATKSRPVNRWMHPLLGTWPQELWQFQRSEEHRKL